MTRRLRCTIPLLAVVAATTASAQDARRSADAQAGTQAGVQAGARLPVRAAGPADSIPAIARVTAGPSLAPLTPAAAGVPGAASARAARVGAPPPVPQPGETRQNKAMMIVGAAGLIVGAVIGNTAGTLIMVGGAGIGLFGLYKYLE